MNYTDAMELLYIFEKESVLVLGWEGWIKHPNGKLEHSIKYQGTSDLSSMSNSAAIALVKGTIMQANTEWEELPEIPISSLLFCITVDT
ncbi:MULTISPECIES: hypothetical protein [Vibrio]|uniref:hypothetical protein n=1 Tax=Vibrio TaxID=662 RepID=UPI0018E41867|nr:MULTISPECIES: hypothetical protein [Vibrio]